MLLCPSSTTFSSVLGLEKWRNSLAGKGVRVCQVDGRGFHSRSGKLCGDLFSPFNIGECVSFVARMTRWMAEQSHWLGVGRKRTTEDDELLGSDHPQCPCNAYISGTAIEIRVYTFLRYPWSSDQQKKQTKRETDVHLHCDNCLAQNKNRFVLWYTVHGKWPLVSTSPWHSVSLWQDPPSLHLTGVLGFSSEPSNARSWHRLQTWRARLMGVLLWTLASL